MHTSFEDSVTDALRAATHSSGDNLLGFDIDLCYALMKATYFSHIKTQLTGDARSMIIATCRLKPKYKKALAFPNILITLWQEEVAYAAFNAYEVQRNGSILTLRFVTLSGPTSTDLCVTGSIAVTGVPNS